jgi:hypothetical protein
MGEAQRIIDEINATRPKCPMCADGLLSRLQNQDRFECMSCLSQFPGQVLRKRGVTTKEAHRLALRPGSLELERLREKLELDGPLPTSTPFKLKRRPVVVEMRGVKVTIEESGE